MHRFPLIIFALVLALTSSAYADNETDRLREALRSATGQVRSLEDQRGALQAKQAVAERDRDRLQKQSDALKAQVKDAEQANQQAVEEFNQRLAERDESLEKWKSAYEEAGGRFSTWDGTTSIHQPDVLITNGLVHDQVLNILQRKHTT